MDPIPGAALFRATALRQTKKSVFAKRKTVLQARTGEAVAGPRFEPTSVKALREICGNHFWRIREHVRRARLRKTRSGWNIPRKPLELNGTDL